MKELRISVVLGCVVLLLVGCSTVRKFDRSCEYKKALPHDKVIVLPKDLNRSVIENHYPVPKIEHSEHPDDVTVVPPGSKI